VQGYGGSIPGATWPLVCLRVDCQGPANNGCDRLSAAPDDRFRAVRRSRRSRRREFSTPVMVQRRETPQRLGSSPIDPEYLVVRTTSSRRLRPLLPTISSGSPAEEMSAPD